MRTIFSRFLREERERRSLTYKQELGRFENFLGIFSDSKGPFAEVCGAGEDGKNVWKIISRGW